MAKKPIDNKQLNYLIEYHQDIVNQCEVHRRVGEQALEELTVRALEQLRQYRNWLGVTE